MAAPKNFRIDDDTWLEFMREARRRNKTAGKVLAAFVIRQLRLWKQQSIER